LFARGSGHATSNQFFLNGCELLCRKYCPPVFQTRLIAIPPAKPVITIPIPVEQRALKRYRNIKNVAKEADKNKLKKKPLIIRCKREEFNHKMSQTYGFKDKVPLASQGWNHRKSNGDWFMINQFTPPRSRSYGDALDAPPTFSSLDIEPRLVKALEKCGFTKLTNIQYESIPEVLKNQDLHSLICAETGNGKTLCFLVPVINNILKMQQNNEQGLRQNRPVNSPLVVIVSPSRELASQIESVASQICSHLGLEVKLALGGSIQSKITNSRKSPVDIVVGSFGGLYKMFKQRHYSRKFVIDIVLDEIDTLVDDTFKDSVLDFLRKFGRSDIALLTGNRIIMTGATFPTNFENYMGDVLDIEDIQKFSTREIHKVLSHIQQKFIRVSASKKLDTLKQLLQNDLAKNKKTLIFSNKASTADFLSIHLNEENMSCINFDHNVPWKQRMEHYHKFTQGQVTIMSATDLASRGLDTTMVNHVINYDFPLNPADYIHRIGRVGRVGSQGNSHVTSLVESGLGVEVLQRIETAVRKNTEIHNVNNNIIRIIKNRAQRKQLTQS